MRPKSGANRHQTATTERDSLSFRPPPSTPQFNNNGANHRDSDASFCSSRPSSSSFGLNSRQHQQQHHHVSDKQSMVRSINSYLSSHNISLSLSLKPLPSAKDVIQILRILLSRFDFNSNPNNVNQKTLEDDLFLLLKSLNCPHKINKSALRAPAAPHAFPQMLAVMHWLVQLADYLDHLPSDDDTEGFSFMKDALTLYAVKSYLPYMRGDDETVELLDSEFSGKMEMEKELLANSLKSLDEETQKLESELEGLKTKPSERELFESQRKDLESDLVKFQEYIGQLRDSHSITEKALEEQQKALAAKVEEIRQIREENEELKKKAESQGFNMRDAERMRRELQAVDREISEAETSRSSWEEKISDLDEALRQKRKELEALSIECNQALRRLKLGVDFQYVFNAEGSTPAEVLGVNYKSTLKPAISSFADQYKKSITAKWEEFIALQQQSKELTTRIEAKRNHLASLQFHIDERERQFEVIRNQTEEYTSWCASEAQRIRKEMEAEAHNFNMMEREATETLKAAELKLEEVRRQSEQEKQRCEYELLALIDSVSSCKEYTEKKISDMKKDLCETTEFISNAYKNTLHPGFHIAV
ncbi:Kinetochore protein NDC80-like protein [Bienertia sinuspersici]